LFFWLQINRFFLQIVCFDLKRQLIFRMGYPTMTIQSDTVATDAPIKKSMATLAGLAAIALWSALAFFTTRTGRIPPFQLAAMTFLIGGLSGAFSWLWRPHAIQALLQPLKVWMVGVGGLFGYHALYFAALRLAPPAEAGLVNYLWPLLIVLGADLLLEKRFNLMTLIGGCLSFAGLVTLMNGRTLSLTMDSSSLLGYLCALGAAFTWAFYSLASSRMGTVPTDAVTGFCLMTSLLSVLAHCLFEQTFWPETTLSWLALFALGLGPVGAAFYLWDFGMKAGDIRKIGFASYATPVLSTGLLVLAGETVASFNLAIACFLIAGGAALARFSPHGKNR
jgi:drug/metabolite transporter (DMT)-like permease